MAPDDAQVRERLLAAGATPAELAAAPDLQALVFVAADLGIRPRGAPLSTAVLAQRSGLDEARLETLRRLVGLGPAGRSPTAWFESDIEWVRLTEAAATVLGDEVVTALLRRTGIALAGLAEATSSAFRVNVMSDAIVDRAQAEQLVEVNLAGAALMDEYSAALGQLFRHLARETVRLETRAVDAHTELIPTTVGFVDLVSSTELAAHVDAATLARLVVEFETVVFDVAVTRGVRIVKTIGDAAMLVADDAAHLCEAALDLVAWCADHRMFIAARAGVATGDVLAHGGDFYGPTVNRAARLGHAAPEGTVMVDASTGAALRSHEGFEYERAEPEAHRGLGMVDWGRVQFRPRSEG